MEYEKLGYIDFRRELVEELMARRQPFVSGFEVVNPNKDNVQKIDAIHISYEDGRNLSPIVYVEQFYQDYKNGMDFEEIVDNVLDIAEEAYGKVQGFDLSEITPDYVREHLTLRMVNAVWNEDVLEKTAHIKFNDLAGVPRLNVMVGDEQASILITKDVQRQLLMLTDDELLSIARENALSQEFQIKGMNETMREMMGDDFFMEGIFPEEEQFYVLSNEEKAYGAIALLSKETLENAKEKIGEEFFVIPSSVHETLLIPESKCDNPADLQEMCKEVNATQVEPTERLGENIYYYNGHKLQICNSIKEYLVQTCETEQIEQTQTRQRRIG